MGLVVLCYDRTMIKTCPECKKEFKDPPSRRVHCSVKCALPSMRRKISLARKGKKGHPAWNKGLPSPLKGRKNPHHNVSKGENHYKWLGDKAGYYAKHAWIRRKFGQPDTCEHCGKTELKGKEIQWANISGTHKREREDWLRLCVKCHSKYDQGKREKNKNL